MVNSIMYPAPLLGLVQLGRNPFTLEGTQTVPRYKYWDAGVEAEAGSDDKDYTRFDGGGTRFFDYRDSYRDPEDGDKYLKFPQIGVFT